MSVFLKVKIKSLAAESQMIRRLENKRKGKLEVRNGESVEQARARHKLWQSKRPPVVLEEIDLLREHRVGVVRRASRNAHLAYAVVRGRKPADSLKGLSQEDWKEIERMVRKYDRSTRGAEELQILRAAGSNPAERAA